MYVPATNPITAKIIRRISLIRMYFPFPKLSGQRTHNSIIAGNANPRADKQNAPNNEMNRPRRGIATANRTEIKNYQK